MKDKRQFGNGHMKIVFWIKGNRGVRCLEQCIKKGYDVSMLVLQSQPEKRWHIEACRLGDLYRIPVIEPEDPNSAETGQLIQKYEPDLFVLAGYGKILKQEVINIPKVMCINLHGGKLPQYRGSSPMNWALINGDGSFGISIIKVDSGVDTGDVLLDRTFPFDKDATIRDLHGIADEAFSEMLVEVLRQIEKGKVTPRRQDAAKARYYPLRFPEDGLVLWDMLTAEQVHNRVRALTEPYPCAYTYYHGRKVRLLASKMRAGEFFGEPGRIYLIKGDNLLVCAADMCLWITKAVFADSGAPLQSVATRYESLTTVRGAIESVLMR